MPYTREDVCVGDYVKLFEDDDTYYPVTFCDEHEFDVGGKFGGFVLIPYHDILDLKLESEVFKRAEL